MSESNRGGLDIFLQVFDARSGKLRTTRTYGTEKRDVVRDLAIAEIPKYLKSTMIKLAGERLHVTQILLVRQIFMTAIVAPSIFVHFPNSLKSQQPWLHLVRRR